MDDAVNQSSGAHPLVTLADVGELKPPFVFQLPFETGGHNRSFGRLCKAFLHRVRSQRKGGREESI